MKRVMIDHFGGPEVVSIVEEADPRPGPGEVRIRVLASGVSLSDAQMRAGTYLGGPKPPFTPGYELVGHVDELGPGCSRLHVGARVGALTQWGANAERVCVPENYAVEVPDDLDPAEVLSLVFIYMTAYQMLHRTAKAKSGERLLVHGAAGRVGTAVLELAAAAGLRVYGTASAADRAAVERLGAGGRLVIYGRQNTIVHGRKNWPGVVEWYAGTALVVLWGLLSRPPAGTRLPDPETAHPAPGLVPGGLSSATRAAS